MSRPPVPSPTRRYQGIWLELSKVPVGKPVSVRVHKSAAQTVRQGVCKEKSIETAVSRKLGMWHAGKMEISEMPDPKNPHYVIISFTLSWDGRRI